MFGDRDSREQGEMEKKKGNRVIFHKREKLGGVRKRGVVVFPMAGGRRRGGVVRVSEEGGRDDDDAPSEDAAVVVVM